MYKANIVIDLTEEEIKYFKKFIDSCNKIKYENILDNGCEEPLTKPYYEEQKES